MSTIRAQISRGAARRTFVSIAALSLAALLLSLSSPGAPPDPEQLEGRAPTNQELEPAVQAAFPRQSYAPGAAASLVFFNSASGVTLQILHSGPEGHPTKVYDEMNGVAVTKPVWVGAIRAGRAFPLRIGNWPSGFYVARLAASDGRIGFAPSCSGPGGWASTASPSSCRR